MEAAPALVALDGLTISKTKELKGTEKRDKLMAWERICQLKWEEDRTFEAEAPSIEEFPPDSITPEELHEKFPKFFGCMAYPYMNGALHSGHAFTWSKVEFHAGVARMQGKRTLTPLGWHLSGMPIKACADKLTNEIKMFGRDFEKYAEEGLDEVTPGDKVSAKDDPTKFSSAKSKTKAKTGTARYQFQIMQSAGIPIQEIHLFADPHYWIEFFPPIATRDLTAIGARIDWRRSFVTTDVNGYYDRFVKWTMNRLKDAGKIKFGKRYTIYSVKDGQPCLDHDRSSGEGVNPQEYTALKMRVLEWSPRAQDKFKDNVPADANVFLVPATLRPETMYGQTNCFVGPKLSYGVFKASDSEYYVITDRAARNMAYQGIFLKDGEMDKVAECQGSDLIGTKVHAPLSAYSAVYVLPMETVLATKGTGVVTSVPSDSPDDYANYLELRKKPDFYAIKNEWISLDIVPIIDTPSYGSVCAELLCKKLKIASPKDTKQLETAKELAYKEGFYQGVMKVGDFKGEKVEVAKPKVRQGLIQQQLAFTYSEPEGRVVSRSGDECIVALLDQWFLDYGEETWKKTAADWVENADGDGLNTYSAETKNQFHGVLNWLSNWAISRSYGLGTRLPFDNNVLVESLSDSTVYMVYYTISHLLHTDIFGKVKGEADVDPEQLTDEVFDAIFCGHEIDDELLAASKIPKDTLLRLRRSFEYFAPLDLRVSGKDLIPNHLTFFIYCHIAIFPQKCWPRGVRANGHLLMNGEKMSKSTGNFMTLHELTKKYGADASRIALADAGDGLHDANFEEDVADNSILRLYNIREWCDEMTRSRAKDELRTGDLNDFQDKIFDNEINAVAAEAVRQYELTNYKLALKAAFYDLSTARDFYREACIAGGIAPHAKLIEKWTRYLALLLCPIAPHFADYLWIEILKEPGTVQNARFPDIIPEDSGLSAAREYIRTISSAVNSAESAQLKKKNKGKETVFDPKKPKKLTIYVNDKFPSWQSKYIDLLREMMDPVSKSVDEKQLLARIGKMGEAKKAMPLVQGLRKRLAAGEDALNRTLPFDERKVILQMRPGLKRTAGLVAVDIVAVGEEGSDKGLSLVDGKEVELTQFAANAVPGTPSYRFENVGG